MQQRLLARGAGPWTLRAGGEASVAQLPQEVRQVLTRRLDTLPAAARQVLEVASVVGQAFAAAAVAAGTQGTVEAVDAVCDGLVTEQRVLEDTGVTVWPDGTRGGGYRFHHALYQQVLYEALGTTRRAQLHRQVGARLEEGYGAQAGDIAAQLALHFERGGEVARAVPYLQQAADTATRRQAYQEAIAALTKGLAVLATLPESPARARHELTLLLLLGPRLMAAHGYAVPAVGASYTRAQTLAQQVGEPRQHVPGAPGPLPVSAAPGPGAPGWRGVPAVLPASVRPARPDAGAGGRTGPGADRLLWGRPGHRLGPSGAQSAPR